MKEDESRKALWDNNTTQTKIFQTNFRKVFKTLRSVFKPKPNKVTISQGAIVNSKRTESSSELLKVHESASD